MSYRIISISIVNNNRLLNKGTREIHYEPKEAIQLILAQNGYGKTTLMWELSPLPAIPANYAKGGYKKFVCELNGHTYELLSDFTKGSKHSFLKDGQELNVGGTITVQKQLVEAELRYTQELHHLLMGQTKFTTLTTQKRKELLVSLCNVDVSYGMRVFASAATNARNVVGAIKHNEQKLVEATAALLSDEDHQTLTAQMAEFTAQTSNLYSNKELGLVFSSTEQAELLLVTQAIEDLAKKILQLGRPDLEGAHDLAELNARIFESETSARDTQTKLELKSAEYDSLTGLLGQLEHTGDQKTEDIVSEITTLQDRLVGIKIPKDLLGLTDPDLVAADALNNAAALDDICLQIEPNPSLTVFNQTTVTQYETKAREIQLSIDRLLHRKKLAEEAIAHMKAGERNSCPDCGYEWIPGYSESKMLQHEQTVEQCNAGIASWEPQLVETREWLERSQAWKQAFMRFRALSHGIPRLEYYWAQLRTSQALQNAPKSLIGTLERFGRQMLLAGEYKSIQSRLELLNGVLEKRKLLEQASSLTLSTKAKQLELEIEVLTENQSTLKQQLDRQKHALAQATQLGNWINQLERILVEAQRLTLLKARVERNEALDVAIQEINQQSGLIASRLQKSLATIEISNHLQKNAVELEQAQRAYEILMAELSPTDGLIADSLSGFVREFVKQLNKVISFVWRSPMLVLPCAVEEGGLNYKFPVKMLDSAPTGDVAETSRGESEMIDFAFVLVAAHYLGVSHYPIFMDEVGGHFSEEHRQTLFDYIKLLVETRTVNQVFIVSHFAATHGSLKHAEINVIDRTGVMITSEVNRHFKVV
jgi:hypothetical protein